MQVSNEQREDAGTISAIIMVMSLMMGALVPISFILMTMRPLWVSVPIGIATLCVIFFGSFAGHRALVDNINTCYWRGRYEAMRETYPNTFVRAEANVDPQ